MAYMKETIELSLKISADHQWTTPIMTKNTAARMAAAFKTLIERFVAQDNPDTAVDIEVTVLQAKAE